MKIYVDYSFEKLGWFSPFSFKIFIYLSINCFILLNYVKNLQKHILGLKELQNINQLHTKVVEVFGSTVSAIIQAYLSQILLFY